MKILIITHTFFPKYIGGTETCVLELAKQYNCKKNKVLILTTDPLSKDSYQIVESKYKGIDVLTIQKDIRKYSDFNQTYLDTKTHPLFEKIISKFKPDIIHYHHLMHHSLGYIDIAKKNKIPQIITLHDFWFQCLTHQRITTQNNLCQSFDPQKCSHCLSDILNSGPIENTSINIKKIIDHPQKIRYLSVIFRKIIARIKGKLKYFQSEKNLTNMVESRNKFIKKAFLDIDLVILPTVFLAKQYKTWGINGKKIITSQDGINTSQFSKYIKKKSNKLRFVYIGSIIYNKGLDVLLKAWSKLETDNCVLKIYGNLETDIKYSTSIKSISKKLKNIDFCGTFPPDQISKIYEETDIVIVPSRWFENAPLVLRNSRLLKIPAIATNLGSIPELIADGKNGYLYKNEDPIDLASKISNFIANPNLIYTLNKDIVKQKSISDQAKELIKVYKNLIRTHAK